MLYRFTVNNIKNFIFKTMFDKLKIENFLTISDK